jgi:eukaryotic-like serine/threonine-protein kinase
VTEHRYQQSSALPLEAGQIISERYLVGEVLGGGGMGVVRAGTHLLLGTPVAIKVIHSELKDDSEAVQRFVNEARATALLKGEHIARVFDVGVLPSGEPYLVMEQLEGIGLDQYLVERGTLAEAEAVDIVLQACEGLTEAHAAGLVHRDIKPANLFLARRPDGQFSVKILDFGIAKRIHASPALTDPGKSLGSPWYMSPEQMLTPASVDARADVWSLGVLLFELLTARLPFEGESVPQVCANVLAAAPLRLRQYRIDLAPELEAILLACLEKEPRRRVGSVGELGQALLPYASAPHTGGLALDDSTPGASEPEHERGLAARTDRPPSYGSLAPLHAGAAYWGPAARWRRRRPWTLALALVVLPLLLLGAWLQYRDPSLAAHAFHAALGTRLGLSPDVPSSSEVPSTALDTYEPATLLQYLHTARAFPETERPTAAPERAAKRLTHEQARSRDERSEAWQRAQAAKRLNDEENKYGL